MLTTFVLALALSGFVLTRQVKADDDCSAVADDMYNNCKNQGGTDDVCECQACIAEGICLGLDKSPSHDFCVYVGDCDPAEME